MTLKAVHFGAGKIGRGFLGQLYFESGYHTTFVDVVDAVVAGLQARHAYPLRIINGGMHELTISNVDAVHGRDLEAVAEVVARADIGSTAVGVNVLPRIAPALALGIARRFEHPDARPIDFIVCENLIDAGSFLREQVRGCLDASYHRALDEQVGFVEASIGRMVPVMTDAMLADDPLAVYVEPYCELPVDANGFKGGAPALAHMKALPNFAAYVARKLFVHNLSHAATAYLGYLRGHSYIWQAIEDARVREAVDAATAETCTALHARYGLPLAELELHRLNLIERYGNRALGDQVARVAADPVRKLGANDRLIGAARLCLEEGVRPESVAFAAAAAIRYDHPEDPSASSLQTLVRQRGLEGVLREVCGVVPDSALAGLICAGDARLHGEGWLAAKPCASGEKHDA